MYMTPAIAVAILTFAVSLHAQPLYYDDTAIIERSAQPIASADAYADAELEARNNHIGDFVQGAIAGAGANKVANHYGYGTTTGKAAVVGGVLNAAAHSEHIQHAGQKLSDAMHHLGQRDAEAEAEAYANADAEVELEARNNHIGDFVKGAIAGAGANKVANHYGYGTTTGKAAVVGGVLNAAAHSEHLQHAGQRLSDAMHHLGRRDAEAVLYQLALQRRSRLRDAGYY